MDRRPEQSGPSGETTPFWERYGLRSERSESEAGCSYTSFINVQCRLQESDKGGRPSRKCERLIRKFRDCGRYVAPRPGNNSLVPAAEFPAKPKGRCLDC